MIEGVIFDFDNTLYNYDYVNNLSLNELFKNIHINNNIDLNIIKNEYDKINKEIKKSNNYANKFNKAIYIKYLLENLNINYTYFNMYLEIYNNTFYENIKLYDNVENILILFIKYNIKIGLNTNNLFLQQINKLNKLNITKYFDIIYTSSEDGNEKPNINIFNNIIQKMNIKTENLIYIGDDYLNDIEPLQKLNILGFQYINNKINMNINISDKFIKFGDYNILHNFFYQYFKKTNELIFLNKYFGQSILNIQGQGGNISVKINKDFMLIKSSGTILGNTSYNSGYCMVNNDLCNDFLNNNIDTINKTKIFGIDNPSIETYFHSFMKIYTIHLHFTLSNIFLCSNKNYILDELNLPFKIIDYEIPGIKLAKLIKNHYNINVDIYFLKNHGLIITSDTINNIFEYYKIIFEYFNNKLNKIYLNEYFCFDINRKIYEKFNKTIICRIYNNNNINFIKNIKYCFPDLAVYIMNIILINSLDNIFNLNYIPDIIIFNNLVFIISINLTKLYCLIETIDSYYNICINYIDLLEINKNIIENMEQEKIRKIN